MRDKTTRTLRERICVPVVGVIAVLLAAPAAHAATQTHNGENIQIIVNDAASPTINAKPSTRALPTDPYVNQYCCSTNNPNGWGSVVWLDNAGAWSAFGSGYGVAGMTGVSNVKNAIAGGTEIVTVVNLGSSGVQMTQRLRLMDGDRLVSKEWVIQNNGTTNFNNVRFYHGGDTMFGGDDSASGFYDPTKSMVYIRNNAFADWGIMGFYANPATPADRYFEGHYSTGRNYAASRADLPNSVQQPYHDAGYYLQWNHGSLAPGASWTIQAFEVWTPGGALQVVAPGNQNASPGSSVTLPFTIQNLGSAPLALNLAASSAAGWATTVVGGSTITLAANSSVTQNVTVQIPEGVTGSSGVTLQVSGNATGTATTTLSIVNVNIGLSLATIDFGTMAPGAAASQLVTVTNTSGNAISLGSVTAFAPFGRTGDSCSGATLANGASCTVTATFSSASAGTFNSTLNIPVVSPLLVTRTIALSAVASSSHSVTAVAGPNGTLAPSTPSPVSTAAGGTATFTFNADAGHYVASISGCGGAAYTNTANDVASHTYTTGAITGPCTVSASFARRQYTVSFAAEGVDGPVLQGVLAQTVAHGESATPVTAAAPASHFFINWTAPNGFESLDGTVVITNVTQDLTVTAHFAARAATSVTVTSSRNPSVPGETVSFTAKITPVSATGVLQFRVDGEDFGAPVPLTEGQATSIGGTFPLGEHQVSAFYAGDRTHLDATGSLENPQVVRKHTTTSTVQLDTASAVSGQPLSITATVTSPTGAASGVIAFLDGSTLLGSVELGAMGVASLTLDALSVGPHALWVSYSGDAVHAASQSADAMLVVERAPSAVSVVLSPSPARFGEQTTLVATVTVLAPGAGVPTGTVSFSADGTSLGAATITGGAATLLVPSLATGTHSVEASYEGDVQITASTSVPVAHVVNPACVIDGQVHSDGALNPGNSCQVCNPALDVNRWTNVAADTACASDGLSCTQDACDGAGTCEHRVTTGCVIGEACIAEGATDPANECLGCFPEASNTSYTAKAHRVACSDDGSPVTDDFCDGRGLCIHPPRNQCLIDGQVVPGGTVNPANSCQVCDVLANDRGWTNRLAGTACEDDALGCTLDLCNDAGSCEHTLFTGCMIDGACVAAGTPDPTNDCSECIPSVSTSTFSSRPRGVACGDDLQANTLDICDGLSTCIHPLSGHCVIDAVTYRAGEANPDNACQSCDPASSVSVWTNRVAGFPCGSDGLNCTADACDDTGSCQHNLYTGCLIDGACVASGTTDPANDCLGCFPQASTTAYSPKAMGVACADDGLANTADICNGLDACAHPLLGECVIDGATYRAGTANPDNACQSCNPSLSISSWSSRVAGFPCGSDGLECTSDICDGAGSCEHPLNNGCLIDGACVSAGATDPENACQGCFPSESTGAYTAKARGVACGDDGAANTADICDGVGGCIHTLMGECVIDGQTYRSGVANPDNGCQACDPSASVSDWSNRVQGFPCASDGLDCTSDVCDGAGACEHPLFTGCLIEGACVASGTLDATNECLACDPSQSTAGYTPRPTGVACLDEGQPNTLDSCSADGQCTHVLAGQCQIDGATYNAGAQNPENACQSCDPAASGTSWTDRQEGFPCPGDGLGCTADVCNGAGSCEHRLSTGCVIDGACVAEGAANPQNGCQACHPLESTGAYTAQPRGVACTNDEDPATLDVCDGAGACAHVLGDQCSIGGVLFNAQAANPENPCEVCDPQESRSRWTARVVGFPCTSDGLDCTTDACGVGGVCVHSLFVGCLISNTCVSAGGQNPENDCQACIPAQAPGAWSAKARGQACADEGDEASVDLCDGASACIHVPAGACDINGETVAAGAGNPENPCQACDPSVSVTEWSYRSEGFPCGTDGKACTQDVCNGAGSCEHRLFEGCMIDGACVAAGASAPGMECMACIPEQSSTTYTPRSSGTACADDANGTTRDVCDSQGVCQHLIGATCVIDGASFNAGAANPENACQVCDPLRSAVAWSNRDAGAACASDGLECTADVCDGEGQCGHAVTGGCVIDGACLKANAVDPQDSCYECDPEFHTTIWSRKPRSEACADDCTASEDCRAGYFCKNAVCRPQQPAGFTCGDATECSSGICRADGTCAAEGGGEESCHCDAANADGSSMALAMMLLGWVLRRARRRR